MAINTDALMQKLFRWTTRTEYNGITFHLRIVGDAVIDDARRFGLLESRKIRRLLRDTDSEEYLIFIDPLNDLDEDELRTLLVSTGMREVMRDYINRNPKEVLAPLNDHPTQEEQEQYESDKEARDAAYVESMTIAVEQWQENFLKSLESKPRESLISAARKYYTDKVCEDIFTQNFEDFVVCHSVYSDDKFKNRMFTLEQYRELPSEIKRLLRDTYDNINVTPDDIKN